MSVRCTVCTKSAQSCTTVSMCLHDMHETMYHVLVRCETMYHVLARHETMYHVLVRHETMYHVLVRCVNVRALSPSARARPQPLYNAPVRRGPEDMRTPCMPAHAKRAKGGRTRHRAATS